MTNTVDRLREAFAKLVRSEVPQLDFLGVYEYAVQATDGNASTPSKTVDANPTATETSGGRKLNLPNITKVPIMLPYGVTPPVGALCTVQFLNGDPARPVVVCFNDPMTLMVFASGALFNARQGDMTAVYLNTPAMVLIASGLVCTAPGSPPTVNPLVFPPPPAPVTSAPLAPLYGLITSGTPQVKS